MQAYFRLRVYTDLIKNEDLDCPGIEIKTALSKTWVGFELAAFYINIGVLVFFMMFH